MASLNGNSDYYAAMVMATSNYPSNGQTRYYGQPQQGYQPYSSMPSPQAFLHARAMQATGNNPPQQYSPTMSAHQASPTCGSNNASPTLAANTSVSSRTSTNNGKRFSHNPYASEPSTPTNTSMTLSGNTSFNASNDQLAGSGYGQAMYASEQGFMDAAGSLSSVTEQFYTLVGSIAHNACTPRGRHLLISVLRLQHLDKIQMIFDEIAPQVNMVVLDGQGCHVVRTLVEFLSGDQLATLTAYLDEATIIAMATSSQHTRRALQMLFERHKSPAFDFIVQVVAADAVRLSMSQQGCIAVMRMVEHALPHQRHHLVSALMPALPTLTMDPYGNYVVQAILQNIDATLTSSVVCDAFAGHWVPLSCNKFASNVMEKVVRMMTGPARISLVRELVFDTNNLLCLMQDGYGNFVLQSVIDSSIDPQEYRAIAEAIRPLLHTSPYGHKIDGKLKSKRFGHRSSSNSSVEGYSSGSNN